MLVLLNLGNKKFNFFYFIISWFYAFNNNFQFQTLRALLYNRVNPLHLYYSIPYSHAAIVIFYIIFIDSSFLINSTAFLFNLAIIIIFSIGNKWKEPIDLTILIGSGIFFGYYNYLYDKNEKQNFFTMNNLEASLEKSKFLLKHLNLGFINIKKDLNFDYNSRMIEILEKSFNLKLDNSNIVLALKVLLFSNISEFNKQIKGLNDLYNETENFLKNYALTILNNLNEKEFLKLLEENKNLADPLEDFKLIADKIIKEKRLIKEYEKLSEENLNRFIKILFKNIKVTNFIYLWKLKNNFNEQVFNIYVRYNKSNESLEFLLSDDNNHVKAEGNQLSDKLIKRIMDNLLNQLKGPIKQINDSVDIIFEKNNNNILENNNMNNANYTNKYNNGQNSPANYNNIHLVGNLKLFDFAGKIAHLKNLKLVVLYIDYYLFKFSLLFNNSNSKPLDENPPFPQEDYLSAQTNTNKFHKINIQRKNFSDYSMSKNNVIFNNKKSSKILSNNNIKINEVFNKTNNNKNYSKMNSKNFYNINLVRKNTPGINNIDDLSNSDVNFLLNENNKMASNDNIINNPKIILNLNFINRIPKKEEEIFEKNMEETKNHQVKQISNNAYNGSLFREGDLNNFLKKKGLENVDFNFINNIVFKIILASNNKNPSSFNKENPKIPSNIKKNDNRLIEYDIDNYSDNKSIKEIIKPQKSLQYKSYNYNQKITYDRSNKDYKNTIFFNRCNLSVGSNDSNLKQYIDRFQDKDPVIGKQLISFLPNIEISIETLLKSYINYFEVSNLSQSKFINYKFILNPNIEMNKDKVKLKNYNKFSIINRNIKKNPYNKSNYITNERKGEIFIYSENAKYYLFYIFFYLNNFLRSGFIVFKTISLLEEDHIRINIDIRGIREYEIDNISPDRVSSITYKDINNNVRNNVLENLNSNTIFKFINKNSSNKDKEESTRIKATALFNVNMHLQNENNLENSNNNNNFVCDAKTLNLSDYKSSKTLENNYYNQNTNKQDVNPVQKQSNNILSINFNANKNSNNNINNCNSPTENHHVNNKFSFSNLADKNFGDLNISNVNKNSVNNSNNLSNNYIIYPFTNNENNSFITKNIFSQSSLLENKGENINLNENPKTNNIINNPFTSNHYDNENIIYNNSERNKENDLIYFESLKNCLKEIGGNLIISMKENQLFCLTIDFPRNHKFKTTFNNEPFADVNYFNQRNNLNNINNVFYINNLNFNCNTNSNANLNNIFNYLVNSNKELLKKTSTGNSNNFILNKQRMFSKVSTENMGFNNFNNPKSYFSQEFLEEILFRQNTSDYNFFNQNILNNNYINNYNIINTFSEPNLIKTKTNRIRGFSRLQTHKAKKRSFSNIEIEKDIKLSKQLMSGRIENQNLNSDIKGDFLAFRKCNSEKFDYLSIKNKKNNVNNEDVQGKGMDNKHNLHSLFFKQYNFDINNKKLFRNNTCNKDFLRRSKNKSIINNDKNNNDTIKIFERIFTKKESFSPDNKNDFIQRKMMNLKNNLKGEYPLDSYEDSSNSDSSYINNFSDQSKRFTKKGDFIRNSNRFKSNFPKNNGLIVNTFESNKFAKCHNKNEESDLGYKNSNINSSQNFNPEKLNLIKNKIYFQEKGNLLSEIHEYENFEDCSAFQDKSIINKNTCALTLKKNAKLKIMIVEDDKFIRQCQVNLIKRYFNYDSDIFIDECEDGIECLYKIYVALKNGVKFDLVITDEKMQYIDGLYLASILKNLKEKNLFNDLKVFLVTFNESTIFDNSQLEINKAYLGLFINVLPKPLELRFLKNIFKLFGY